MSDTTSPRIYLACLASYNAGILHGDWVELDGSEDIHEQLHAVLESSTVDDAEEWAVHDHEYCGHLSEYPGLDMLECIKAAYEHTEALGLSWEAFTKYCEHQGHDLIVDHILEFRDNFAGSAPTLVEWCESHLEDSGQLEAIPENLRCYFNYEAFARDVAINDVLTIEHEHEVLVFWHH